MQLHQSQGSMESDYRQWNIADTPEKGRLGDLGKDNHSKGGQSSKESWGGNFGNKVIKGPTSPAHSLGQRNSVIWSYKSIMLLNCFKKSDLTSFGSIRRKSLRVQRSQSQVSVPGSIAAKPFSALRAANLIFTWTTTERMNKWNKFTPRH